MVDILDQARELREKRLARDEAKAEFDLKEKDFKEAQAALFARFRDEKSGGVKVDGIGFTPVETTYGTIQDRSVFIEWAEAHDPELVKRVEAKDRLNELVRRHHDDGEPLPPGVGFYTREYVSQRAA